MAGWVLPEMSPWKRRPLTIPPDSWRAWLSLATWEIWMGTLVAGTLGFAARLIATAPEHLITVFDFTNCYAPPPVVQPCERVTYRAGGLYVAFSVWCGLLLLLIAAWLVWEVWSAAAPKPITDDFLKLIDDSFGYNWRRPRTWPWRRFGWAYGFTLLGAVSAFVVGMWISTELSARSLGAPTVHIETSQRFRPSR